MCWLHMLYFNHNYFDKTSKLQVCLTCDETQNIYSMSARRRHCIAVAEGAITVSP